MFNALYSPYEFPWAAQFFAHKPIEPGGPGVGNIAVNATDAWFKKVTIEDFRRVATGLQAGSDMVLYTHGDADADIGVSMWVANGTNRLMTLDVVQALCDLTPQQFAQRYRIDVNLLGFIQKQIAEIQACQLNHVAFRSCNIGKRPEYLRAFARLFNIRTVSAPRMRDFFARDGVRQLYTGEINKLDKQVTPQALAKMTKVSTRHKERRSDAKYRKWEYGVGSVRVLLMPVTYATFRFDVLASTGRAIEQFYRENYLFRVPITFADSDFAVYGPEGAEMDNPFFKVVPLFGLSENGGEDRFVLPNEPSYMQQIQVVQNEHYIGGVPMYDAPPPDPNAPVGTLRDRLRRRVHAMFR